VVSRIVPGHEQIVSGCFYLPFSSMKEMQFINIINSPVDKISIS